MRRKMFLHIPITTVASIHAHLVKEQWFQTVWLDPSLFTACAWSVGSCVIESFWLCRWKRTVSRASTNGRPILHLLKNGLLVLWRFSFLFVPQPVGVPERQPSEMCTFSWWRALSTLLFSTYQPFISTPSHFILNSKLSARPHAVTFASHGENLGARLPWITCYVIAWVQLIEL